MRERVPDNYDLWLEHEAEEAKRLAELPECCYCGYPVQDDYYYLINDEIICPDCMNRHFRRWVD